MSYGGRDDGVVPLICPTCQIFSRSLTASCQQLSATLHGVVFHILVGSANRVSSRAWARTGCGCRRAHCSKSNELNSDAVLAAPYNAAWKPQTVIRDDQCEFIGNAEKIRKLQRCTGAGYVANNAWILVAAIVHLGGFHNFNAWRNPGFDHCNIPGPNTLLVAWFR